MNHGLLFAGPPPPLLGGCERKDEQNRLGGRPSDTITTGAAVGGPQLRSYIAGRQLIAKIFAWNRRFTKICPAPSTSWSLVLKMQKPVNDGLDLTWWPRGGKKRCKRTEQRIYATDRDFCWRTCQCRYLSRSFETACRPLGPEGCSRQKIRLSADSAPAYAAQIS